MGKLENLKLKEEEPIELPDEVPDQFQEFGPPPPPGAYIFQMPESLDGWETLDTTVKDKKVQRVVHVFADASALTIVQAPQHAKSFEGGSFRTRISNKERKRDKDGLKYVSDMYYLLKESFDTVVPSKATNSDYGEALDKQAGKRFGGDLEWSAFCNPEKEIYIYDAAQGKTVKSEQKGCGNNLYHKDLKQFMERDEKGLEVWPDTITCPSCEQAVLRPYAQIARFRKAE